MTIRNVVHFTLALAVLSLAPARKASAAVNCGSPGEDQVIVWEHNFTGNCDVLEIGNHPFSEVSAMSVGNDTISSVSVGKNVKVTLYEHDLPGTGLGDWMPVISSRSVVSDFNDKTSSIRVERRTDCPLPGAHQVVVWSGSTFTGNCDVLDLGYTVTFAKIMGLSVGNDDISSVKCGASSSVLLWQDDLGSGASFQSVNACAVASVTGLDNNTSSLVVQETSCAAHSSCSAAGSFCELPTSGCTDTMGTCTIMPTSCPLVLVPSCGCDGVTYGNDCERQAAGVPKWYDGYCADLSCPLTTPQPGTSCAPANISCIYSVPASGVDCLQRLICTNAVWSLPSIVCGF